MRKLFTIATALLLGATTNAQTVANFDTLSLPNSDTFYVNYSMPKQDVGFDDGLAHFECVYDTAWGGTWSRGFAYSNKKDSVTSGYLNQYSAKTGIGYNGSNQYLVAWASDTLTVSLKGSAMGKPTKGFYITNNTYAYNSMRDGDGFAKKFGGVPNNDSDWYKLTVNGYLNGTMKTDYIEFYLADFRNPDSTKDYIIKTWEWVDLLPIGQADSFKFSLSSSDTGQFGMNTPAYFCMDNFETYETLSVSDVAKTAIAKVYPNPAVNSINVEVLNSDIKQVYVYDMSGKALAMKPTNSSKLQFNVAQYPAGTYIIKMVGDNGIGFSKFVKQ